MLDRVSGCPSRIVVATPVFFAKHSTGTIITLPPAFMPYKVLQCLDYFGKAMMILWPDVLCVAVGQTNDVTVSFFGEQSHTQQ